jgi:hypothetical protein
MSGIVFFLTALGVVPVLFLGAVWTGYYLIRGRGWRGSKRPPRPSLTARLLPRPIRWAAASAAMVVVAGSMLAGGAALLFYPAWVVEEIVGGVGASDARAALREAPPASLSEVSALFARVSANLPAAEITPPRPCPDDQIVANVAPAKRSSWFGRPIVFLPSTLHDSLAAVAVLPVQTPGDKGWEWANEYVINGLLDPAEERATADDYRTLLSSAANMRYLVVLKASRRTLPREIADRENKKPDDEASRRLVRGVNFVPGVFQGGVFIMDVRNAAAVCQVALDVTSSADVDYTTVGIFASTAQKALMDDFRKRFTNSERSAIRQISPAVRAGP